MGRYIAKLGEDAYVDWSTVVDAPVSWVHDRDAAVREWTEERVARADLNGTSIIDGYPAGNTPEEIVRGNRAGPEEAHLTLQQVLERYASPEAYKAFDRRVTVVERRVVDSLEEWTENIAVEDANAEVRPRVLAKETRTR